MSDPLKKLVLELRSERCPLSVQRQVARRTGRASTAQDARAFGWRFTWGFGGAALAAILAWSAFGPASPPRGAAPASVVTIAPAARDQALVVAQAHGAFVMIGRILIDARSHAEQAVLQSALPPLADSYRIAKTKLTQPL